MQTLRFVATALLVAALAVVGQGRDASERADATPVPDAMTAR